MPVHLLLKLIKDLSLLTRGDRFTLDYIKSIRSNLLNYLSNNSERDPLSKCTKDGIPMILGDLIPIVRSKSYLSIAMILTILYSTRSLKLGKDPDISTITKPYEGVSGMYGMHMGSFGRELGYKPATLRKPKRLLAKSDNYRTTKGPQGHALMTAILDALVLPDSLISSLEIMGGPRVRYVIEVLRVPQVLDFLSGRFPTVVKKPSFRRLSYFPDKETKVRTIGILDGFSQESLKPLHDYLGDVLKKINQDCTLDQSKFQRTLNNAEVYWSVDLSSATDRFPIAMIQSLLKVQLPSSYVDAGVDTMVGYPFDYRTEKIFYSVGNPMGAYSSFNSFALTHHYIIYYCCKELGKKGKTLPYALLGDDIVIGDEDVGQMYMEVIKHLGLEVSKLKTHKSKNFFEFAKRLYLDGVEITPFPVSALKESGKAYYMLTNLIFEQSLRNWLPAIDVASSVSEYYGIVMSRGRRFRKEISFKAGQCEGILKIVHDLMPVEDFFNELSKRLDCQLPILSHEVAKNIFANAVVEAFSLSNISQQMKLDGSKVPLVRVVQQTANEYSAGLKKNVPRMSDLPIRMRSFSMMDVPQLAAVKRLMKVYSDLEDDLRLRDQTGADWEYYMRTFALPRSDSSIWGRQPYVVSKTSDSFAQLLRDRMFILKEYPSLLT